MNRLLAAGLGLSLTLSCLLGCGDDPAPRKSGPSAAGAAGAPEEDDTPPDDTGAGGAPRDQPVGTAGAAETPEAGEGGAGTDPCEGIPTQGQCVNAAQVRTCVVPTGNGAPTVVTTDCRIFEHCDDSKGAARCVLDAGACIPKESECTSATQLRSCDATGAWQSTKCPGACQSSAVGSFCVQSTSTATYSGFLEYAAVPVLANYSDWAKEAQYVAAAGVLVLSGNGTDWLDAALVDDTGAFSLKVPTTNTGVEQLAFFLLHPDAQGSADLGVFQPAAPNGVASVDKRYAGQPWSWAAPLSDLSPGQHIRIEEADGSGAVHVYRTLLAVQQNAAQFYKSKPGTLAAWLRLNTAWDCGTCFAPFPAEIAALPFDSQMFISATQQDRSYWSDAVTVHEAGHYVMWSYGTNPNEGGAHCLGLPTSPGQAWSEGWATGFSSILRGDSVYWDKQQGSMFWLDLAKRQYDDAEWKRPRAAAGLMQSIDENEVAAMMWSLSTDPAVGSDATLLGLQSPSATKGPFKRGYTRHTWQMSQCRRTGYFDTGEPAPMFADYLDGLVCAGASPAAVDQATSPQQAYPYPSAEPLCQ